MSTCHPSPAVRCPHCGGCLETERELYGPTYLAHCPDCADYDTPYGRGPTPRDAAADYAEWRGEP